MQGGGWGAPQKPDELEYPCGFFSGAIVGQRAGKEPLEADSSFGLCKEQGLKSWGNMGGAVSLQSSAPCFGCYSLSLHCPKGLQQPLPLMTSTSTSELLLSPHSKPNNLYPETRRVRTQALCTTPHILTLNLSSVLPPPSQVHRSVNNSFISTSFNVFLSQGIFGKKYLKKVI